MFKPAPVRLAPVLVAAGAVWTTLVALAPLARWTALYFAAHLVCHQIPARSFQLAGGPMAVCARCFGLYIGAVMAGAGALAIGRRPTRRASAVVARWVIVAAALPTAFTLAAEWLVRWPVGNNGRFVAALPLGAAAAWLVIRALEVDWRT